MLFPVDVVITAAAHLSLWTPRPLAREKIEATWRRVSRISSPPPNKFHAPYFSPFRNEPDVSFLHLTLHFYRPALRPSCGLPLYNFRQFTQEIQRMCQPPPAPPPHIQRHQSVKLEFIVNTIDNRVHFRYALFFSSTDGCLPVRTWFWGRENGSLDEVVVFTVKCTIGTREKSQAENTTM